MVTSTNYKERSWINCKICGKWVLQPLKMHMEAEHKGWQPPPPTSNSQVSPIQKQDKAKKPRTLYDKSISNTTMSATKYATGNVHPSRSVIERVGGITPRARSTKKVEKSA